MQFFEIFRKKDFWKENRGGLLAVALAILLSLPGINWGKVECWNLDQMGLLGLRKDFLPRHYLKPPLLTYLNQFLVITPLRFVMGNIFSLKQETQRPVILIFSRLLTVSMFAGSVWLVFLLLKQAGVGEGTASAAALLMGTSSGMLIFNRFLTADSPLLFWMLLAFYFSISAAQEKSKGKAILAGLCIGLATAMKYNGLFVCAALPAAVLATMGWKGILWRGFWLGVVASPLGFAMGNPGFVFDFPRFYQDFLYNLYVTPVYEGQTNSHSYAKFWTFLPEIIGWGGVFLLTIGLVCLILFFSSWLRLSSSRVLVVAAAAVFLLYYWKIGGFPRAATRFVLPSVPFLLLLGAIGWGSVSKYLRKIGVAAFVIVLGYNSLASLEAGFRFLHDPRMPALDWMRTNVGEGEVVENSYAPNWSKLAGFRGKVIMMPTVTGRASLFPGILPTNPVLERGIRVHETPPEAVAYFSEEALRSRNPTWIAFTSQGFDFSGNETVQRYYGMLDAEGWGYEKVFEKTGPQAAPWSYPKSIDFLEKRIVILRKKPELEQAKP